MSIQIHPKGRENKYEKKSPNPLKRPTTLSFLLFQNDSKTVFSKFFKKIRKEYKKLKSPKGLRKLNNKIRLTKTNNLIKNSG